MDAPSIRRVIRQTILLVMVVSLLAGVGGFYVLLRNQGLAEARQRAQILLSSAMGVRGYTAARVKPALEQAPASVFHEETVPSFAAQTVLKSVGADAGYTYREPVLNPTAPADRASDFEVGLIRQFRDQPRLKELTGVRAVAGAQLFYLARPITITDPQCLQCHDTPARAPAGMLAKYGQANGFGWTNGETVGMQILTVPVTDQFRSTLTTLAILAGGLLAIFALIYLALSLSLEALVIGPVQTLARAADGASRAADFSQPLPASGALELRALAGAIERLRTSLAKALAQISARDEAEPK